LQEETQLGEFALFAYFITPFLESKKDFPDTEAGGLDFANWGRADEDVSPPVAIPQKLFAPAGFVWKWGSGPNGLP